MSNEWKQPDSPPPPLFLGEKERDLVKQLNDEVIECIIGQQILYYPLDRRTTNFHMLYGEAIEKNFLKPIRVYALVKYSEEKVSYESAMGIDETRLLSVNFHKRRLNDDQDLEVTIGDFLKYGDVFFEIVSLSSPRRLFGQVDSKFEVIAQCIRAREGLFDAS